jgi:hypothetical protein
MAFERKDRVKDQTATTGTGTITIDLVAPTGYRNFSAHTTGATVNYLIIDSTGLNWEVGQGVWTSGAQTLTRPSGNIRASSNSGSLVNFGAGLKTVASLPTTRDFLKSYYDSGTTNALDYTNGEWQRWAPSSGSQTLTITGWPASGEWATLVIEGVNLKTPTITWPTIQWMQPDGTFTTSASSYMINAGIVLKTSGVDFIQLMTRDGGTTIYGKVLR